jgi:hypothetical protein
MQYIIILSKKVLFLNLKKNTRKFNNSEIYKKKQTKCCHENQFRS